jgi:hypothetical protein
MYLYVSVRPCIRPINILIPEQIFMKLDIYACFSHYKRDLDWMIGFNDTLYIHNSGLQAIQRYR